ncbi:MAG: GDSL-type esterase/lipase family protein [Bacteroidota bacterium]
MNIKLKILAIGVSLLLLNSCDDDSTSEPPSNPINKIMALGASRVEGDRPEFESFRYELWKDLIENGWTFDFIGTRSDEASYPAFNNNNFDNDHEGRGGWTSGQILGGLNDWLAQTGPPDIVLFSSPGGNDILEGLDYDQGISNINAIIDVLQAKNPNVTIIIEQPAQFTSALMIAVPAYADALERVQQEVVTIATEQSTASSRVIPVDMYTGFSDSLMADLVHYNDAGAEFIATRYYNVLVNILE